MTVRDIYEYIDFLAPFSLQAQWDNSGLLTGSGNAEVERAVVCLDVTKEAIAFAHKENAQLIISHHPVIFKPQKNFLEGNIAFEAASKGISIISAHTNLDKAPEGVNDTLCRVLGFDFIKCPETVGEGFLNIADISFPDAPSLAEYLKKHLGGAVSFCDAGVPLTKAGICAGSGADFFEEAKNLGCNAYITGEASYHEFLDASALGISLFAAGHYETEALVVSVLTEKLRNNFKNTVFSEFIPGSVVITEK